MRELTSREKRKLIHLHHFLDFARRRLEANPTNKMSERDVHTLEWVVSFIEENTTSFHV